jgi:hypothetical protein
MNTAMISISRSAVTGADNLDDAAAAVVAVRDVFGRSPGFLDQPDDPVAALAAIDSTAEVDRVAQDRQVLRPELVRESPGEFVAHLLERAVAVRLEERDHPAGMRLQRAQCGAALLRIVAEIVYQGDARGAGADDVEPAGQPRECGQRADCSGDRNARRHCPGYCRESVREVVPPGHAQLQRMRAAVAPVNQGGTDAGCDVLDRVRLYSDRSVHVGNAEGDHVAYMLRDQSRLVVVPIRGDSLGGHHEAGE